MGNLRFWKYILLVIISSSFYTGNAQIAKFEALYIYNICRYIEWPPSFVSREFVIGVVGQNNELVEQLEGLAASRNIQNKKVKVKYISSDSEVNTCHIVFFTEGSEDKIASYMFRGKKALFMSESDNGLDNGSDINFFMSDSKLKFALSRTNVIKKDINVSGELEQLAAEVR